MFESVDIEEPNDSEIRLGENNRRKMFQEKKKFTMSKEDLLQPQVEELTIYQGDMSILRQFTGQKSCNEGNPIFGQTIINKNNPDNQNGNSDQYQQQIAQNFTRMKSTSQASQKSMILSPRSIRETERELCLENRQVKLLQQQPSHSSNGNRIKRLEQVGQSRSSDRQDSKIPASKLSKSLSSSSSSSMSIASKSNIGLISGFGRVPVYASNFDPSPVVYKKPEHMIQPLRRGTTRKGHPKRKETYRNIVGGKKQRDERMNKTWRERGLFVLFYVRKFIVYMKNISQENKFRSLSRTQFHIINDKTSSYYYYRMGDYFSNAKATKMERLSMTCAKTFIHSIAGLSQGLEYITNSVRVFSPESTLKLVWDGFMLVLLMINIFYIPLKLAFDESSGLGIESVFFYTSFLCMLAVINKIYLFAYSLPLDWSSGIKVLLSDAPGWAFVMDIFVSFNSAFYRKGVMIRHRGRIVRNYLKGQLFWDLIVVIPFVVSQYFQIKYLDAVLLFRFNKIRKIVNNYLDLLNLRNEQAAIVDLCKLVAFILFVAHFCGCSFYLLSYLQAKADAVGGGIQQNWLSTFYKDENAHSYPWLTNYITCFYWAVITMITVGYGDITPSTTLERGFVIIVTLLSCGVFAYSVNSIGSIISAITEINTTFKQRMSLLSIHMKKRGLSTELQMKVKKYFEYLNDERREDNQEGEMMLSELAGSLKHDIALDIYGKILNSKKLLKLNFTQEFLRDLAPKMKEKRHGPEEIIYLQNEPQNKLFFVMNGTIDLCISVKNSPKQPVSLISKTQKGGVFGEISFFSGILSDHSAISQNVVSLVYITIEEFLAVLKNHQIDRQKFQLIKDNFTLYSSSRGLGNERTQSK